jgi:hypothetical protein
MQTRLLLIAALAACGGGGGSTGDDDGAADAAVDAFTGPTITRTFQQGADGYAGTKSVGISTYGGLGTPGQYNQNGMTFADGQNDWCTGTDIISGNYSEVWLLRFDDLGLPTTTQVVSATLTIHGYGDGSHVYFAGSYLAKSWYDATPITCAGCSDSPVGWRWANGSGAPWTAMGAGADGTDTLAGKAFRVPATGEVSGDGQPAEYTTDLDPALVQQWLAGTNNGLRIIAGTAMVHMGYVQAQRDGGRPVAMRPKLTIVYANP